MCIKGCWNNQNNTVSEILSLAQLNHHHGICWQETNYYETTWKFGNLLFLFLRLEHLKLGDTVIEV
jgi:hypothetical protein